MNERPQNLSDCPACGARARRETAKFCLTCGHDLSEDYAPLDALRASYNLRRDEKKIEGRNISAAPQAINLFKKEKNGAASTAMAFLIYSLVPYLGILFCPGALVMGGIGLAISYQKPNLGGRQTAAYSIFLGAIVSAIQILLWWLLYLIPEFKNF